MWEWGGTWVRGRGEEETQRKEGWVESPGLGLPTERPRLEVLPKAGGRGVQSNTRTSLLFPHSPSSGTFHWVNPVRNPLAEKSGMCHLPSEMLSRTEKGKEQMR